MLPTFLGCCSVDKSLCALLVNSSSARPFVACLAARHGKWTRKGGRGISATNYLRLRRHRRRLLRQQINKFDKQYKRLPRPPLLLLLLRLSHCAGRGSLQGISCGSSSSSSNNSCLCAPIFLFSFFLVYLMLLFCASQLEDCSHLMMVCTSNTIPIVVEIN